MHRTHLILSMLPCFFFTDSPQANYPFVFTSNWRFLRRKDIVLVLVGRRTSCLSLLRIRLTYIGGKSYEREGEEICKKSLCLPVQGSRGGPGRKSLWSFPINRGNWRIGRAVTFSPSVKCLWPLYLPLLSRVCECGWGGGRGYLGWFVTEVLTNLCLFRACVSLCLYLCCNACVCGILLTATNFHWQLA